MAENEDCLKCGKHFVTNQIRMRCHGCKKSIHGKCCSPQINRAEALQYKQTAFFCHKCKLSSNFEDSVHIPEESVKKPGNSGKDCNCDCKAELALLRRELDTLKGRVAKNSSFIEQKEKNLQFWDGELEKRNKQLRVLTDELSNKAKQFTPSNNQHRPDIVVYNIPEFEDEDTMEIATSVIECLDKSIPKEDILTARRLPTSRSPPLLKISMKTNGSRVKAVAAAKSKRMCIGDLLKNKNVQHKISKGQLRVKSDVDASASDKPLIVDHSSSRQARQILSKALKLKRDGHIFSTWIYRDMVFYKLTQAEPKIRAKSDRDLPSGPPPPAQENPPRELNDSSDQDPANPLDTASLNITSGSNE